MIFQRKDKFYFKDAKGILRKFNTKAEAEKAAGGVQQTEDIFDAIVPVAPLEEIEHGNEETQNNEEENESPNYGWQIDDEEEIDSKE